MINDFIIVGGGNAGFISALILHASFTGKKIAKKNDNKIVNLKFGNFCVIANENSF